MSKSISVVIVTKNEESIIGTTLKSIRSLADEIVIYDSGSTDNTITIAEQYNARIIHGEWEGYGINKRKAIAAATNDWVLNIDADEVLDEQLQKSINNLKLNNERIVYKIKFKNFIGDVCLNWGNFGFDKHVRLFNRRYVNWNNSNIHERLLIPSGVKEKIVNGHILHYTMKDTKEFAEKTVKYAMLNAELYFANGKRSSALKQYLGPLFAFIKNYFLKLGFLDGWMGFFTARMSGFYTYLKYARLYELHSKKDKS